MPNMDKKTTNQRAPLRKAVLSAGIILSLATIAPFSPSNAQDQRSPAHQAHCLKLESALARSMHSTDLREIRQKLHEDRRNLDRIFHRLKREAKRRNCYSYSLFSKEVRRTPRCIRLDKKIRRARQSLAQINRQLNRAADAKSNQRHRQDKIIRALARNKCGRRYEREARKRGGFNNWFNNGFFSPPRERYDQREQQFQFATHRTLCVRLCDGYYFPISFATTSNRFAQDQQMCQSRCAAPARLYTHPNPGGTTEQMLSVDGLSYESLKHAWRFKKEFVKGCSCKVSEYNPDLLNTAPTADQNDPQPLKKEQSKTPVSRTKTAQKTTNK